MTLHTSLSELFLVKAWALESGSETSLSRDPGINGLSHGSVTSLSLSLDPDLLSLDPRLLSHWIRDFSRLFESPSLFRLWAGGSWRDVLANLERLFHELFSETIRGKGQFVKTIMVVDNPQTALVLGF